MMFIGGNQLHWMICEKASQCRVQLSRWTHYRTQFMQQFGGFDSVWMPMVATSNTYIKSKIQGHLSLQVCFCINTVVTVRELYFSCQRVYTFFGPHCIYGRGTYLGLYQWGPDRLGGPTGFLFNGHGGPFFYKSKAIDL